MHVKAKSLELDSLPILPLQYLSQDFKISTPHPRFKKNIISVLSAIFHPFYFSPARPSIPRNPLFHPGLPPSTSVPPLSSLNPQFRPTTAFENHDPIPGLSLYFLSASAVSSSCVLRVPTCLLRSCAPGLQYTLILLLLCMPSLKR